MATQSGPGAVASLDLPLGGFAAGFLFVTAAEGPVKLHQKQ